MFTGLIEKTATVTSIDHHDDGGAHLSVALDIELQQGDSIALDGCCLTVDGCGDGRVSFALSHETQQRTTFTSLKRGQRLNVERPLRFGERLHGHLVTGHVDGVAEVVARQGSPTQGVTLSVAVPAGYDAQLLPKAAIALNGASLTIATVEKGAHGQVQSLSVCLIPETCRRTNLAVCMPRQLLNFESDVLGKYVTSSVAGWQRQTAGS